MSEDNETVSGMSQDTWNIADSFCKLMVLKPLYLISRYELIARYGYEEMLEGGVISDEEIVKKRIEALNRYKDTLTMLFTNINFIIRAEDKFKFDLLKKRVTTLGEYLPHVARVQQNYINHQQMIVIEEDFFTKLLSELIEIKQSLITPINNAGLIFRGSGVLNLDELMNDIIEGG